jgi:hypothetical protein
VPGTLQRSSCCCFSSRLSHKSRAPGPRETSMGRRCSRAAKPPLDWDVSSITGFDQRLASHRSEVVSVPGHLCDSLRLYEGGRVVNRGGGIGVWFLASVAGERRSSLYGLLGGRRRRHWRPAAGAQVQKGRQAARRRAEPPGAGAKGSWLVSMCQIASVSFRATSIWATLAPHWRPRRRLLRW